MHKIGYIVSPWRGLRGHDACGDGNFGASRSGNSRAHKGVDYLCVPGDICLSPFDGIIKRIGRAYSDSDLGSLHIQGLGEYWLYYAKILYTTSDVAIGQVVRRGGRVGVCQSVAAYHNAIGTMKDHLHMELQVLVDVQLYMETPQ